MKEDCGKEVDEKVHVREGWRKTATENGISSWSLKLLEDTEEEKRIGSSASRLPPEAREKSIPHVITDPNRQSGVATLTRARDAGF